MSQVLSIPRRVVTGHRGGKSVILEDAPVSNVSELIPGLVISDVWVTDTMPVNLEKTVNIENTLFPNTPRNGSYFHYVKYITKTVRFYIFYVVKNVKSDIFSDITRKKAVFSQFCLNFIPPVT